MSGVGWACGHHCSAFEAPHSASITPTSLKAGISRRWLEESCSRETHHSHGGEQNWVHESGSEPGQVVDGSKTPCNIGKTMLPKQTIKTAHVAHGSSLNGSCQHRSHDSGIATTFKNHGLTSHPYRGTTTPTARMADVEGTGIPMLLQPGAL